MTIQPEELEPVERSTDPALFRHCIRLYDAMMLESGMEELPGVEGSVRVYEGALTKTVSSLGLGVPMFSATTKLLEACGCIEQLARGGGGHGSRWIMMRPPDLETMRRAALTTGQASRRLQSSEIASQQIRDLNHRIAQLEDRVQRIEERNNGDGK